MIQSLTRKVALAASFSVLFSCSDPSEQTDTSQVEQASEASAAPEVDEAYIWDLTRLYESDAAWELAYQSVQSQIAELEQYKGTLAEGPSALLAASDAISEVYKDAVRLLVYATLKADEDTRIADNEERNQKSRALLADFGAAVSWFDPELLEMSENKISAFLAAEPGLAKHQHAIENTMRGQAHTLSNEIEAILAKSGKALSGASSIYKMLANANMPWPELTLSTGETFTLNQSGYVKYRQHMNREDRLKIFQSFWGTWASYEATLGAIMNTHIQGLVFSTDVRGYDSSMGRALFGDNMPEAVYRTLVEEVNAGLPTLHRYFKLRKQMLGIEDDLGYHDIYPPLVNSDIKYDIERSISTTREALLPLGEEYIEIYDKAVSDRWMHVYPQPGKRSGAYMFGAAYDVHPYVLLNHNDTYDSASTFAHEFGHAVHSVLSNREQTWETAGYATFIAETAAIMNEMLLQDLVVREAKTDDERLYYLGIALEQMRGTFFRQTMFAEFELKMNEEVEAGNVLTGAKLSKIYLDLLKRYHGHDEGVLVVDDLYAIEWAYIPHFYRDFYVFQYSTSIAAAAGLAEQINSENHEARDAFINLLKAGGSDYAYELMKQAGMDMAKPDPYRALIARMDKIMDEMEAILAKK